MKLTTGMKERIISSIIEDTFGGREKEIRSDKLKIADDIYEEFYSEYLSRMGALPNDFFIERGSIYVRVLYPGTSSRWEELSLSTTRLLGACHYNSLRGIEISGDSPHAKRLDQINKRADRLEDDKKRLKKTLASVILPVTTDKKLIDAWPEAEKWIPPAVSSGSNLPAIRTEDLNALILSMQKGGETE